MPPGLQQGVWAAEGRWGGSCSGAKVEGDTPPRPPALSPPPPALLQVCAHCGSTTSCLWRCWGDAGHLCNRCGCRQRRLRLKLQSKQQQQQQPQAGHCPALAVALAGTQEGRAACGAELPAAAAQPPAEQPWMAQREASAADTDGWEAAQCEASAADTGGWETSLRCSSPALTAALLSTPSAGSLAEAWETLPPHLRPLAPPASDAPAAAAAPARAAAAALTPATCAALLFSSWADAAVLEQPVVSLPAEVLPWA